MKDAIKIANKFSSILREWLTTEELQEINDKNADYRMGIGTWCATHEYCDPNQAMINALAHFGIDIDFDNEEHINLINDAWKLANDNKFQEIGMTLDVFKKSRKKVNLAFMQEYYGFGDYGGQFVDDTDQLDPEFYVYGVDGGFGWIEIRDTENSNNSMKFFLQISNWDACSDDLDYFEKKLYEDHYLSNICGNLI